MEISKKVTCHCNTKTPIKRTVFFNIITGTLFFLFPKCPLCWAAYASFFSYLGLGIMKYPDGWEYAFLGVFILTSILLIWKHYKSKTWLNIIFYVLGFIILLLAYYLNFKKTWLLGIVSVLMLLSSIRFKEKFSLKLFFNNKRVSF